MTKWKSEGPTFSLPILPCIYNQSYNVHRVKKHSVDQLAGHMVVLLDEVCVCNRQCARNNSQPSASNRELIGRVVLHNLFTGNNFANPLLKQIQRGKIKIIRQNWQKSNALS